MEGEHEPYRLYNLDVFEYLAESSFGLYGAVPVMQAHKAGVSVGAFWRAAQPRPAALRSEHLPRVACHGAGPLAASALHSVRQSASRSPALNVPQVESKYRSPQTYSL